MTGVIFAGGPILSMDASDTRLEAVAIRGDRIVATGSLEALRRSLPEAVQHDLAGRTLLPAFIDPHGHFPDSAMVRLLRADLSESVDLAEVFHRLAARVARTPVGDWVMGAALDERRLAERRLPTRDELDTVSRDHPIWVIHASGHCGVANSAALARQGIGEGTPDPEGGRYLRDGSGRLTGGIEGLSAMGEMGDTHFLLDADAFARCFAAARAEYLAQGVTLAQNAWTALPLLELFAGVAAGGDPGIDLILLPVAEIEPAFSREGLGAQWPGNGAIALGPRKLLADGSFLMRTALLTEPYLGSDEYGLAYIDRDTLMAEVCRLHRLGFQIHTHCNGDAASDMFLDAVAAALAEHPRADHRHTIIHGQVMRRDQMARCAALGVTVSFFPAHVEVWGDQHHDEILGPARAVHISPTGWAKAEKVRFTIHNDASVTPTRPLRLVETTVNRRTRSGRVLGPEQRVDVMTALRAHTIDAAWQVFREHERGSIEVGKLADLVILDDNPLVRPETIGAIGVSETWRRGERVYLSQRPKVGEPA
ncbi:amidohydrolase [Ruegeria sp. PrR005]|uniref:Amidohydrolase family protein n=1 Tax=Ruegeria sp. PrR005 TaxID=2706882 RepID=A0A6B2NWZ5_9RHOB|nr:amidohydrolase [Ruegeria sp. PrR005]NDW47273.1 amidohydrolase family protein [Ruegeria sp. PrR005]